MSALSFRRYIKYGFIGRNWIAEVTSWTKTVGASLFMIIILCVGSSVRDTKKNVPSTCFFSCESQQAEAERKAWLRWSSSMAFDERHIWVYNQHPSPAQILTHDCAAVS